MLKLSSVSLTCFDGGQLRAIAGFNRTSAIRQVSLTLRCGNVSRFGPSQLDIMARLYSNLAVLDPAVPLHCADALRFLDRQPGMIARRKSVLTIRDIALVLRNHERGQLRLGKLRAVTITPSVSTIGNIPLVIGHVSLLCRQDG